MLAAAANAAANAQGMFQANGAQAGTPDAQTLFNQAAISACICCWLSGVEAAAAPEPHHEVKLYGQKLGPALNKLERPAAAAAAAAAAAQPLQSALLFSMAAAAAGGLLHLWQSWSFSSSKTTTELLLLLLLLALLFQFLPLDTELLLPTGLLLVSPAGATAAAAAAAAAAVLAICMLNMLEAMLTGLEFNEVIILLLEGLVSGVEK